MPYRNPEVRRAYHRVYYQEHRDYFLAKAKRWEKEHPEAYRLSRRKCVRRRRRQRKLEMIREAMKP